MKTKIALLSIFVLLAGVSFAFAEEAATVTDTATNVVTDAAAATNSQVDAAVAADQTVTATDLNVAEPTVLPDSPFYFFKNWSRGVQSALTFNKIKKAELRAQFANEKLVEARKLSEKTQDPAVLNSAMQNYETEMEKAKDAASALSSTDPAAEKLLNKLTDFQLKRQKLMDNLASKLPEQAKERVLKAQEKTLEKFAELMQKENPEKIKERMEKALDEQKGGQFKNFKNLEVLLKLEEKLPEQAKAAIQRAQENALNRLHGDLNQMSPEDQTKFKTYLEKIGGDELKQAEIINRLEKQGLPAGLKEKIKSSREEVINKVEKRLMNIEDDATRKAYLEKIDAEKAETSSAQPTSNGEDVGSLLQKRIELRKEEQKRIDAKSQTGTIAACAKAWEPVCGVDGKTYSNICKAKVAGTAIASKGACANVIKPMPTLTPKPINMEEYYKQLQIKEAERATTQTQTETKPIPTSVTPTTNQ
ncbi:MAG: hypothetical protein HZC14_03070 [Candidatus Niyogibacteria bacterium]|nr:hypothetical protein [Candidatus Niyogibacteria bacterium]